MKLNSTLLAIGVSLSCLVVQTTYANLICPAGTELVEMSNPMLICKDGEEVCNTIQHEKGTVAVSKEFEKYAASLVQESREKNKSVQACIRAGGAGPGSYAPAYNLCGFVFNKGSVQLQCGSEVISAE